MTERYVTARELARTLGVSLATVKRWTAAGVPSETWGMRVRRYRVTEVQDWLRAADTVQDTEHRSRDAATPRSSTVRSI